MKKSTVVILCAAGILAAVLFFFVPKELSYREAVRLMEEGKGAQAYERLQKSGAWRDSAARIEELQKAIPGISFSSAKVWDTVTFGEYEQDGDPDTGPEPLEWYVLYREREEDADRLLLLSRDCLACMAWHSPVGEIRWEKSTIRTFLNGTFYETAFSGQEQALITPVEHDGISDRVFLPDRLEMTVYFPGEQERWLYARAKAAPQAVREGIYVSEAEEGAQESEEAGYSRWWLRSNGNEPYSAQFVEEDGNIFEGGAAVDIDYIYGLRPAVWVRCPASSELGKE